MNSFRDLKTNKVDLAKVILTGIPFDKNASIGKGASLAPKRLRELSYDNPATTMDGIIISEAKIFDSGDVVYENESNQDYFKKIEEHLYKTLKTDKFNLVFGGDHSVAIGTQEAFKKYALSKGKIPAIIHIDAHPDICDSYEGTIYSHACPIKRAIDNGYETKNIVIIGARSYEEQEVHYLAKHPEIKVYKSSYINEFGISHMLNEIKAKFDDKYLIYLSYDIDANDPSFAPGTGTPETFGLHSKTVLDIIVSLIRDFNVQMMDIVEIAPPLDNNDITSWLALKTLYEVLYELLKKQTNRL